MTHEPLEPKRDFAEVNGLGFRGYDKDKGLVITV
jgi:hypothetical protein